MSKIAVIGGAGNIGRSIVFNLINNSICDEIVSLDLNGDLAKGYVLDIMQSMAVQGKKANVIGTGDYSDIAGADVVIVPAGFPRKDGMTRDDLLTKNISVISGVAEGVKKYAPNAFVIIITNPLDLMVYAAYKLLGFKKTHVVGMAGVLDGARLKYQLSQALNVETDAISPMVVGAHNDNMVPLLRHTTISGISVAELIKIGMISREKVNEIIHKVKTGGAEIVKYLGNGSAFYGPASSAVLMADSYINNNARILSCSTMLTGEYGVQNLFVGTPALINGNGVEKAIELDLNSEEKGDFKKSVESIEVGIAELNKLMAW
jgi:malate dehydrogenase